jgi:chemotaxis protein MotB
MSKKSSQASVPAWVTTFADLCTLLLSFFVLLFSFSEVDKEMYKQVAGSMRDAFGVQREIRTKEPPKGLNVIAREFSPGTPAPTTRNEIRQFTTRDSLPFPGLGKSKSQSQGQAQADAKKEKEVDAAKLQAALEDEISAGLIELEVQDQRIIVRIKEKGSFPSGSAHLERPFEPVVDRLANALQATTGEIVISGHTDSVPINTSEFHSNWELSSARAVTVARAFFENSELAKTKIHLEAYADTRPLDSNDTSEGRARNRRVEISVEYGQDTVRDKDIP